jgi:glycosyltransferase involved in cell wall biosynthesis
VGVIPLVAVEQRGFLTEYLADKGVPFVICRFPPWRSPLGWIAIWPFFYRRIRSFLKEHAPGGVGLIHGNNVGEGGIAAALAKKFSCTSVMHIRDGYASEERVMKYRGGEMSGLVVLSQTMWEEAARWTSVRAVEKIYDCFDPDFYKWGGKDDNGKETGTSETTVLVMGDSGPGKGWLTVARAIRLMGSERQNVRWVFLGGTREDEMREIRGVLEQCKSRAWCEFPGRRDDAASFYRKADVVLFPSKKESFGRVIIEAGMFSRPLVSARVGVAEEMIVTPDHGWLFNPDNPGDMAAALTSALKDASRNEKGKRLSEKVMKESSCSTHNEAMRSFYERLTVSPKSR